MRKLCHQKDRVDTWVENCEFFFKLILYCQSLPNTSSHTKLLLLLWLFISLDLVVIAIIYEAFFSGVKECENKGIIINYKKKGNMVISKTKSPICVLEIENDNIKYVQKLKCLGIVSTEDGKCETEIQTRIRLSKEAFQDVNCWEIEKFS